MVGWFVYLLRTRAWVRARFRDGKGKWEGTLAMLPFALF